MVTSSLCDDCKASGLPILPVRYVPVPNAVKQTLPGWAGGDRVKSVPLGQDFHYALRTLRAGYVYLYYDKNARGSKQWECYAVTEDGLLVKQPNPQMAPPAPPAKEIVSTGTPSSVRTFPCSRRPSAKVRLPCLAAISRGRVLA